jgi:uncharacterized protein YciI
MFFVVITEAGPAWDRGRSMREQDAWPAHRDFMNALAESGFVVLGGPLPGGPRHRALLIVEAPTRTEVERRLAEDPWAGGHLTVGSVEPWEILLDGQGPDEPASAASARVRVRTIGGAAESASG